MKELIEVVRLLIKDGITSLQASPPPTNSEKFSYCVVIDGLDSPERVLALKKVILLAAQELPKDIQLYNLDGMQIFPWRSPEGEIIHHKMCFFLTQA